MFPPPLFWEGELFHKAYAYPIYLIECSVVTHQCVPETGQPLGGATQFASAITLHRNADALRYSCLAWICIDSQRNVIGSATLSIPSDLAKTHQATP